MRSNSKIKSKEILINILTGKSYTVKELDKIHYIQKDLRYLKRASIISTTIGKTKKRVLRASCKMLEAFLLTNVNKFKNFAKNLIFL